MASLDSGFVKGDSGNLPYVDVLMIMEYFNNNKDYISAELRGVKMERSARPSYGDNAIGYVQIKAEHYSCKLKAKITPEHKLKSRNYNVSCTIDTKKKCVQEVRCHDCSSSEGGCKHAVAFLMWLHRRSEDPSPTEKVCYWKKSAMAAASTTKKFATVADFGKNFALNNDNSLLEAYVDQAKKRKVCNTLMRYHLPHKYSCISLHFLAKKFIESTLPLNPASFLKFCTNEMNEDLIKQIEDDTKNQSKSVLWEEMRYGRVTASKFYETTRCKTSDGTLVENILGAKVFQTPAMYRGLSLENDILDVLAEKTSLKFKKSGIILSKDFPYLGASPDAISKEYVVEIKSPTTEKCYLNYINADGSIGLKFVYQMQLQMYLSKRKKAIFVVAKPNFETSREITTQICSLDEKLLEDAFKSTSNFWNKSIYPNLI